MNRGQLNVETFPFPRDKSALDPRFFARDSFALVIKRVANRVDQTFNETRWEGEEKLIG